MRNTVTSKSHTTRLLRCLWLIVLLVAVAWVVHAQEALAPGKADEVNLRALLSESVRKSDQNWEKMSRHYYDYTFKWRRVSRKRDSKGRLSEESELYEVFVPTARCWTKACRRALVLLEENGKPVPPERIEKERLKAGKEIEKAEREAKESLGAPAAANSGGQNWMRFYVQLKGLMGKGELFILDGQEILDKCDFYNVRRERVMNREMIALDFRPRPESVFGKKNAYMPLVEGRIWIDALDKVFVRLAAWPKGTKFADATSSDDLLKAAALAYDLVRTKEGIWFFRFGRINGEQFPELFPKLKTDFSIEQFDYINFRVEVENSQILAPEK